MVHWEVAVEERSGLTVEILDLGRQVLGWGGEVGLSLVLLLQWTFE